MRFWHPNLPVSKRTSVLEEALQAKEDDRLRRYNPPLVNGQVAGRGMEKTRCSQCWQSGFESIRVVERGGGGGDLDCACGQAIS